MEFLSPPIHQTALYRAKAAYANMIARCLNANGNNPAYSDVELRMTKEEWLTWAVPQYEDFMIQFPNTTPNASRFNDDGHYEINNIHIIPQKDNRNEMKFDCQAVDGIKICSRCGVDKPISKFNKKRSAADGLDYWCRTCKKDEYQRVHSLIG